MANTEGMSDEFVASLMTTDTTTTPTRTTGIKATNENFLGGRRGLGPEQRQRRRLQERMDMPFPQGGPAARIIRPSPQQQQRQQSNNPNEDSFEEPSDEPSNTTTTTTTRNYNNNSKSSLSMVGEIQEKNPAAFTRSHTTRPRPATATTHRPFSRFVQQQQYQQQQQSLNGFPSVHVPLGTFCKKDDTNGNPMVVKSRPTVRSFQKKQPSPSSTKAISTDNDGTTQSAPTTTTMTTESLLEASKRDAEGMLQGMTIQEIMQEQKDLTKALSPETIAFLRKRGSKSGSKKTSTNTTTSSAATTPAPATSTSVPHVGRPKPKVTSERRTTKEDKVRLAQVLSEVKSHQDLDQAYHEIMKEQHPLERNNGNNATTDNKKEDFAMACDLLRSTNSRQTLWAARVVHKTLLRFVEEQRGQGGVTDAAIARPWPLLLPVSLRCLLDEPVLADSGYLLHTFVLRSLYSLLQLTSHPDYVIEMDPIAVSSSPREVHVHFCLDDAIPSPRLDLTYSSSTIKPLTTTTNKENETKDDTDGTPTSGVYATESSSTSAQADGEAFDRDPMWTLLSKMKMVPRIAQLLLLSTSSPSSSSPSLFDWPPEAWVSFMGILAMMAQRSPGAASAMAHHPTLLSCVVSRVLPCLQEPNEEGGNSNLVIAYVAFRLFGTLARQSRVTAKALPLADILPPLLARHPMCDLEFNIQQMGLQLWRTVLRYGLGVEAMESMMTAAARHLALPSSYPYSLSIEFLSAFTEILHLSKLIKLRKTQIFKIEEINSSHLAILSKVEPYLSSSFHVAMLDESTTSTADDDVNDENEISLFRWNTARLRFLTNYNNLSSLSYRQGEEEESSDVLSMEQALTCLETLDTWTDEGSIVDRAWKHLGKYSRDTKVNTTEGSGDIGREAAASSFLDAFIQFLLALTTNPHMSKNRMVQELARSISRRCLGIILTGLRKVATGLETNDSIIGKEDAEVSLVQLAWINQSHFAVCKLISHCRILGEPLSSEDVHLARMLAFHLLGRLQRGQESMAAVVFSQDFLFQATSNPLEDESSLRLPSTSSSLPSSTSTSSSSSSPISSLFLWELCGSEQSRKQMDHSFKLQHGFGVSPDGLGAFALDSLLSTAEQPPPGAAKASSDLSLPLGPMWLWQSLTGQIRTEEEGTLAHGFDEATKVVTSVLGLLMELEEMEDLTEFRYGYSKNVPVGAKLYYLMNVCLHVESLLRDDRVLTRAEAVLDRYWPQSSSTDSILVFARACTVHTDPRKGNENLDEKDQKLLELFHPDIPNEASLSKDEMRSLDAFLDDMVEAYNDYGAQYDFFTKCMRMFLLPLFPSSIRCKTLKELRGVLHLLSLPTELQNPDEMRVLLQVCLSGDVVVHTTSRKDPPEVLDAVTTIMVPNYCPRPLNGFIEAYALATMTRALAVVLRSRDGGALDVMKKRLFQIDVQSVSRILWAVSHIVDGTKEEVVQIVLQSLSNERPDLPEEPTATSTSRIDLENQLKTIQDSL